jgi:hypothetical protein
MLFLSEGQAGDSWELSNKTLTFRQHGSIGQKNASALFSSTHKNIKLNQDEKTRGFNTAV